jgi:hypothetical protein
MKFNTFILPITQFLICRDSLDCPKNNICVRNIFFNYCKEIKPTYRPSYVTNK